VNWTGAFIVPLIFDPLRHSIKGYGCFWLFAFVCGVAVIFFYVFVPETKGRSLEEIQDILQGRRAQGSQMHASLMRSKDDA